MTEQPAEVPRNRALALWGRLPAIGRGLIAGIAVGIIGIIIPTLIMQANLNTTKALPWSLPLILGFLWVFVRYFRGEGPPSATANSRRQAMGWNSLSAEQWKWAAIGSFAIFLFVPASVALTFRFVEMPPGLLNRSSEVLGMPVWVAISYVALVAITAGVVEEAAFRGYMQRIIARRHGAWIAIIITAMIFWFAHFNHETGPVRGFLLVGAGLMMGYLANQMNSIVPLVIAHTASDIYTGLISRDIIDGSYILAESLVQETGVDAHLIIWTAVTLVCVLLVILAGQKLEPLKPRAQ